MRSEQKRIAIAKACGWIKAKGHNLWCAPVGVGGILSTRHTRDVPDYFNDLNAMHKAEATLSNENLIRFTEALLDICGSWPDTVHANAQQRAQAFGITLGLYK